MVLRLTLINCLFFFRKWCHRTFSCTVGVLCIFSVRVDWFSYTRSARFALLVQTTNTSKWTALRSSSFFQRTGQPTWLSKRFVFLFYYSDIKSKNSSHYYWHELNYILHLSNKMFIKITVIVTLYCNLTNLIVIWL